MNLIQTIVFVFFAVVLSYQYVNGLTCFHCSDCGDPFDTNIANRTITINHTNETNLFCRKVKGANIIDRNITDSCEQITPSGNGNGIWCCNTDFCNHTNEFYSKNTFVWICAIGIVGKFIWS